MAVVQAFAHVPILLYPRHEQSLHCATSRLVHVTEDPALSRKGSETPILEGDLRCNRFLCHEQHP